MGRFIKRTLMFFCLLGVLLIGMDLLLMHGLRQRRTHVFGVWNRLMNGKMDAQILFTGSSRSFVHFDAEAIGRSTNKRCFNIGMDGTQINLQYPWLKNYLELNPKPELIVQGVDIISLMPDTQAFYPSQYPPYLNNDAIYNALIEYDNSWARHRYIPFYSLSMFGYGYAGIATKGLFGLENRSSDPLNQGYEDRSLEWDGTFDRFKIANPDGKRYGIDPRGVEQLKKTVKLALGHNVPIVLVYAPELAENFAYTIDRNEIIAVYQDLSEEFNIPFWDLSKMGICEHRKYFYNSQHLNVSGVAVLTKEVSTLINEFLN